MAPASFKGKRNVKVNAKNTGDGLKMLKSIKTDSTALVFFDPQYRAIMDKMKYGNEGSRQRQRFDMPQMTIPQIRKFAVEIARVLQPSGHVVMWMDKFVLCTYGAAPIFPLAWTVDLVIWDKMRIGMGYRTCRRGEYVLICQKPPQRAKGIWIDRGIPDVWPEKKNSEEHPHSKPHDLQKRILLAVTSPGNLVVDPCAGGYGVLKICKETGRKFMGCDVSE